MLSSILKPNIKAVMFSPCYILISRALTVERPVCLWQILDTMKIHIIRTFKSWMIKKPDALRIDW